MVRQEIYGYLLTHYAISALICRAATEADIDPDRVKFLRTVRIIRRRVADPAAFSPERRERMITHNLDQLKLSGIAPSSVLAFPSTSMARCLISSCTCATATDSSF
jgi:hypothetical protein